MGWGLLDAVQCLTSWAVVDSNVLLDEDKLIYALNRDAAVPTREECEVLVCGGDDGFVPDALVARFIHTDEYLHKAMV